MRDPFAFWSGMALLWASLIGAGLIVGVYVGRRQGRRWASAHCPSCGAALRTSGVSAR